jgi:hypothetical protein
VGIEGDGLDGAPTGLAPLGLRVVVAVALAPDELDAQALQELDHRRALAEVGVATGERRTGPHVADDVLEVGHPVVVGVGDPLRPHERVVGQPDDPARHGRRPADELALLDDEHLQPGFVGGQRPHESAAAADDREVGREVPARHRNPPATSRDAGRVDRTLPTGPARCPGGAPTSYRGAAG